MESFARDFQMLKKGYPQTPPPKKKKRFSVPPNVTMTPFHNKKIITFIIILESILTNLKKLPTILTIIF